MSVCDNFVMLMDYCREIAPDLLTITGDLPGEDGSRSAYDWIWNHLPEGIPHLIIPGNHDNPETLFEVFQGGLNRHPDFMELIALDEIDLLFVNTASKVLPEAQIDFISSAHVREGSILFIHHPTKYISGGYMDINYPLENRDEVDQAISDSNISHVFCGHYHTEFEIHDDYHLYLTPSPAFEVSRDSKGPEIGPPRVPVREINVDGSAMTTRVIYLDD